jgi:16S rRNA (guanine966-N2)-methyltransferase
VLDLFSGTGSLGLEALSRGAARCTFCERHRPAVAVLRKNIEGLGCGDIAEVLTVDLLRMRRFPETPHTPFQVVFLDPPFGFMDPGTERDLLPLIDLLVAENTVSRGAVLVHQIRRKQSPMRQLAQFVLEKEKPQGSVRLAFYRFSP